VNWKLPFALACVTVSGSAIAKHTIDAVIVLPFACDSLETLVRLASVPRDENGAPSRQFADIKDSHCFFLQPGTGLRERSRNGVNGGDKLCQRAA
jgi:hypothetical protein